MTTSGSRFNREVCTERELGLEKWKPEPQDLTAYIDERYGLSPGFRLNPFGQVANQVAPGTRSGGNGRTPRSSWEARQATVEGSIAISCFHGDHRNDNGYHNDYGDHNRDCSDS